MPNTKHGLSEKLLLRLFIGHRGAGRGEQGQKETAPLCVFVASVCVCECMKDTERDIVVIYAP